MRFIRNANAALEDHTCVCMLMLMLVDAIVIAAAFYYCNLGFGSNATVRYEIY
jgi:hypothetical protein